MSSTTELKNPPQNFEKTTQKKLSSLFNLLGAKGRVISVLIARKNRANVINLTIEEIAAQANTSYRTTIDTLKLLEEQNFIRRKTTKVMIHPDLLMYGADLKKRRILEPNFNKKNF